MKGDLHPAAVRLCACLPVRTHEARAVAYTERESANNTRECVINGRRYESLTEAARQLGCARETLRRALEERGGRYDGDGHAGRGGHNARAIIVEGERYASMTEAKEARGCGLAAIHKMLDDGRARYAGKHE